MCICVADILRNRLICKIPEDFAKSQKIVGNFAKYQYISDILQYINIFIHTLNFTIRSLDP